MRVFHIQIFGHMLKENVGFRAQGSCLGNTQLANKMTHQNQTVITSAGAFKYKYLCVYEVN